MINKTIDEIVVGWRNKTDDYDYVGLLNDLDGFVRQNKHEDSFAMGYIDAIITLLRELEHLAEDGKTCLAYSVDILMVTLAIANF